MDLLSACERGALDDVKRLLNLTPAMINQTDDDGYSCLHRAAYNNHYEIVKELIQRGASIHCRTNDGWQPIHSAVHWDNFTTTSILLHAGTDVNSRTDGDNTSLHLASWKCAMKTLLLLLWWPYTDASIVNQSGDTALQIALRNQVPQVLFEVKNDAVNLI